ncbi:hypothetical protein OEZ71_20085 [Defluviimonas sp. WL0050]|uniref:Uncharacterized protein n=1 Tax=Albidovulum litorale TaxID=2984134 RepID=A0ABT2ZTW7_9RHOB|nr:hypothetical protein [Defluviimonas sp. WL0050]
MWTPSERKAPAGSLFVDLVERIQDVTPAIAGLAGVVVGVVAVSLGIV